MKNSKNRQLLINFVTLIFQFSFKFKIAFSATCWRRIRLFRGISKPFRLIQNTAVADKPSLSCRKPPAVIYDPTIKLLFLMTTQGRKKHLVENAKTWYTYETWAGQTAGGNGCRNRKVIHHRCVPDKTNLHLQRALFGHWFPMQNARPHTLPRLIYRPD